MSVFDFIVKIALCGRRRSQKIRRMRQKTWASLRVSQYSGEIYDKCICPQTYRRFSPGGKPCHDASGNTLYSTTQATGQISVEVLCLPAVFKIPVMIYKC